MCNPNRNAFGFIELTIIIALLATLLTGSLIVSDQLKNYVRNRITEKRIEVIMGRAAEFYREHNYLPCPASPTANAKTDGYGTEVTTTNSLGEAICSNSQNVSFNNNMYKGGVPVQQLGLSNKYALDSWGRKIYYIVEGGKRFSFRPTDLSGLDVWADPMDSSTIEFVPGGFQTMRDKSGNNKDVYSVSTNRPTFSATEFAGNKPGLSMVGASRLQANVNQNFPYSIYIVAEPASNVNLNRLWGLRNGTATHAYLDAHDRWEYNDNYLANYALTNLIVSSNITSTTLDIRVNRVDGTTYTGSFNSPNEFLEIGNDYSYSAAWGVAIGEIVTFTRLLTTNERDRLENYLDRKWEVTSAKPGTPAVRDTNDNELISDTVLAVYSAGVNGAGAHTAVSSVMPGANGHEWTNSALADPLYTDFKSGDYSLGSGWRVNMDDILRFFSEEQLKEAAGL